VAPFSLPGEELGVKEMLEMSPCLRLNKWRDVRTSDLDFMTRFNATRVRTHTVSGADVSLGSRAVPSADMQELGVLFGSGRLDLECNGILVRVLDLQDLANLILGERPCITRLERLPYF
jgi:hypothetical protein